MRELLAEEGRSYLHGPLFDCPGRRVPTLLEADISVGGYLPGQGEERLSNPDAHAGRRCCCRLRRTLGETRYDLAWARGRALSAEAAVAVAVGEDNNEL